MNGVLTKGIKLSYKSGTASTYTDLTNLYEIPDLGGEAEAIEITTLTDSAHMYMNGILNYGDSIGFSFYLTQSDSQFLALKELEEDNTVAEWKVSLPDGTAGAIDTTCVFSGTCSVVLDGKTYNEAMTYKLNIKPSSSMVFA